MYGLCFTEPDYKIRTGNSACYDIWILGMEDALCILGANNGTAATSSSRSNMGHIQGRGRIGKRRYCGAGLVTPCV